MRRDTSDGSVCSRCSFTRGVAVVLARRGTSRVFGGSLGGGFFGVGPVLHVAEFRARRGAFDVLVGAGSLAGVVGGWGVGAGGDGFGGRGGCGEGVRWEGETGGYIAAGGGGGTEALGVFFDGAELELDSVGGGLAKVFGDVWQKLADGQMMERAGC